jgi:hypothetical protein
MLSVFHILSISNKLLLINCYLLNNIKMRDERIIKE